LSDWTLPPKGGHMESASQIYLQNMTWKQIDARLKQNDIIIVPIGSTEAHGPHACIGEDTFLVTRMAEAVAQKVGCTVAQPVWYGSHPYHHMGMPGTIIVPEEIFIGQLKAIMVGLWNMGFRKQILLNGHGQEYVIPTAKDGGPWETPFIHADEVETSWSLALFPEFMHMEDVVDTEPRGYLPDGHIDKAGNLLHRAIAWYGQVGCGPMEIAAYQPGVVGKASKATAEKAYPGVRALLDYMVTLHDDIKKTFPPGKLPPIEEVTMRPKEEIEAVLKGPFAPGGRSIYSLHWPF
jgi:3-dehydro-scyllo-inosose hydrolase